MARSLLFVLSFMPLLWLCTRKALRVLAILRVLVDLGFSVWTGKWLYFPIVMRLLKESKETWRGDKYVMRKTRLLYFCYAGMGLHLLCQLMLLYIMSKRFMVLGMMEKVELRESVKTVESRRQAPEQAVGKTENGELAVELAQV